MDYEKIPPRKTVDKVINALKPRGISAEFVATKEEALARLKELIPAGAELMCGGSTTLEQIGFIDILKSGKHNWNNLKDKILSEKNAAKQAELRKNSVTSDYFLGSIHAVAETGEIVVASATGSQIPAYAFSSNNVIWVVGTQKIVPTLNDAFKRVREYCLPWEDKRMKSVGASGTTIGKLLIFEREILPRKIKLIFVGEKLGF